jgi:hypothetical protein
LSTKQKDFLCGLTFGVSCRRLMTLITDNLTKGNRKNIESALIGGQLNAMVHCS